MTKKIRPGLLSARASIILVLIPIINLSFMLIPDQMLFFGPDGLPTQMGGMILTGFSLMTVVTVLIYRISRLLFRILCGLVCVSIPVIFIQIDTRNIVLQIVIITIALFFFFYLTNLADSRETKGYQLREVLVLHNLIILGILALSTRFGILHMVWTRVSMLIYLILYTGAFLIMEKRISEVRSQKKLILMVTVFMGVVLSYVFFQQINYLLTFLFLLGLLFFNFTPFNSTGF